MDGIFALMFGGKLHLAVMIYLIGFFSCLLFDMMVGMVVYILVFGCLRCLECFIVT